MDFAYGQTYNLTPGIPVNPSFVKKLNELMLMHVND